MSYDLWVLRAQPDADLKALYEDISGRESHAAPDSEQERELRRLAADLQASSDGLDAHDAIGEGHWSIQLGYGS